MSEAVMSWSCGVVRGAASSSATTSLAGWQPDVLGGPRYRRPRRPIGIIGRALFLALVVCRVVVAAPGATSTEADLLAVLRSESPEADKALSCKFLAVNGSAAAVGDLATLLANPRLASWARIALEVIPGDEASAALREAAARLNGRLLVGVINSLGVRGDSAAVPMLAGTLGDEDPEVAAAAAWALGRIATVEAGEILAQAMEQVADSPEQLASLAEAAVLCAANLQAAGSTDEAIALYGVVRAASVSEQRRAEAIRGTIIAKESAGIPLLVETLRSPTKRLANMAVFTARDLGLGDAANEALATAVDAALIKEIETAASDGAVVRAVRLIDVLSQRSDGSPSPPVTAALARATGSFPKPIRLAAIAALGRAGDATVVDSLLTAAADDDPEIADTARNAVAALADQTVDREITNRLAGADATALPALLDLVGRRRIDALTEVLPLVNHPDARVRIAAIVALGPTIDLQNLGVLVAACTAATTPAEAEASRTSLREASVRMPDREGCATTLAAAIEKSPVEAKTLLLDIISEVGGSKAVETMASAAQSSDEALQDAATRLLGKWMTADAAPILLQLATADPAMKYRTRALRGYLRIARQFVLPDTERAEMCRRALAAATEEADRKAVLEILVRYPSAATLAVAEEAATMPGLEADAVKSAEAIRGTLPPTQKAD